MCKLTSDYTEKNLVGLILFLALLVLLSWLPLLLPNKMSYNDALIYILQDNKIFK